MGILVEYKKPLPPAEAKLGHVMKLLAMEQAYIREHPDKLLTEEETTIHHHCEGVYVREFHLAKGQWVTGEVHKKACINILLKGKIEVIQSDGSMLIEAPEIYESIPGEKKALYALEDTVFLNVHATEETDPTKLREEFTVPPEEYIEQLKQETRLCLG